MPWWQIVLAVAITAAVLLQKSEAGLGSAFGGDSSAMHTKRGVEKGLFVMTIILAALFIISAIMALVIRTI
ncbi:MAG TPA: preprotein translocase subunit SecG [Candidatus Paceibacterota bacterium]